MGKGGEPNRGEFNPLQIKLDKPQNSVIIRDTKGSWMKLRLRGRPTLQSMALTCNLIRIMPTEGNIFCLFTQSGGVAFLFCWRELK